MMASGLFRVLGAMQMLQVVQTAAQTTTLPPPHTYSEGRFTSPNTSSTQIFSAGSTMIVSWESIFKSANIYLIFGESYNAPWTLISGTSETSFQWIVDDHGNNSLPFVVRAVDALGSDSEQQGKGFLTGQFWIKDDSKESSTTSSSSSTQISTTAEVTAYSGSQGATSTQTSADESGSRSLDDSRNMQTTNPTATTAGSALTGVSSSATMPPSTAGTDADDIESTTLVKQSAISTSAASVNVTAIGVGAGLGALVIVTIVTLGAICVLRRRRKWNFDQSSKSPRMSGDIKREEHRLTLDHKRGTGSRETGHQTTGYSPKILFEAPDNQRVLHELGVTLPS